MDKNQNGINSFFKDIHIWGKLSILCPKLMCHYCICCSLEHFWPKNDMCLWIYSQENPHHHDQILSLWWKNRGILPLNKLSTKKLEKINNTLYFKLKKLLKKNSKVYYLSVASFHVFQHPKASPITRCHPLAVP